MHSFLEFFTLDGIAITSFEFFWDWRSTNKVLQYFMQIRLRINIVQLFLIIDILQLQIMPVLFVCMNAVQDRFGNAGVFLY